MRVTVTAPGKVVLLGEYAVLENAPALVMAVDRRVHVSLQTVAGTRCTVSAPAWSADTAGFELGPSGLSWPQGQGRSLALVRHVIEAYFEHRSGHSGPAFRLDLDSSALMAVHCGRPAKLGLGSSAALTVALCRALDSYIGSQSESAPPTDLATLIDMHSGFQGRRGSGLDIATSLNGGLLEYRRWPHPRIRPTKLPADVGYSFVWSGHQAATGGLLASIERWRSSSGRHYDRLMETLTQASEAGIRAAAAGDGDEFLRLIGQYASGLEALGRASGTDIVSAPHRRAAALADPCGVVYKPCGAGGGDIGVALSRDPEAMARFRARLESEGFEILSLRMDESGATTQSRN